MITCLAISLEEEAEAAGWDVGLGSTSHEVIARNKIVKQMIVFIMAKVCLQK